MNGILNQSHLGPRNAMISHTANQQGDRERIMCHVNISVQRSENMMGVNAVIVSFNAQEMEGLSILPRTWNQGFSVWKGLIWKEETIISEFNDAINA